MRQAAIRVGGQRRCGALSFTPEEESIDELLGDDDEPDPLTPGDLWFRGGSGGNGGGVVYSPD